MDSNTMKNMMQASSSAALAIATSATPPMTYVPAENGDATNSWSLKKQASWASQFGHIDSWRKASCQYTAAAQEAVRRLSGFDSKLTSKGSGLIADKDGLLPNATVSQPSLESLSNLEHFQLGSQFETDGDFAAACTHYMLAIRESPAAPAHGAASRVSGDISFCYTTKLAIQKQVKWLEWAQETDAQKKKLRGLNYIYLLYLCRSDKTNGNDDLLGATHCLNSMGLLEQAKSCYEHYVNGIFEPSDQILTRCGTVADDLLQNIVERFQLNLDAFDATTAVDHEGLYVSSPEDVNEDESGINSAEEPNKAAMLSKQVFKKKRSGSHAVSSSSDDSSTSGNSKEEPTTSRRGPSQSCTELGFDASSCLLPLTPRRTVLTHDDAHSNDLRQFCYSHPVVVLRDMHAALDMNLINYSTKAIVDVDADCPIEDRTQLYQPGDMNIDIHTRKPSWDYYSEAGRTTVKNIALYQLQSFLQQNRGECARQLGQPIHFGTNLDLSDTVKWHAQLDELDKLPQFLRVTADTNMLSYIDYELLGVNTVQMYIKVGGNRTPGHQENNNFCSVNVNIGPGDCEWFCVDFAHWEQVHNLCDEKGLDFLKDAWWPYIDDLTRAGVPVYKFIQKPGDVVWVNIGTVHWVQALSVCNNIAWNVGPLTAYQLKTGIERYEYNRIARFQSIIPMTYLIWSLAQNGAQVVNRSGGAKLFSMLKTLMRQSLEHCQLQLRMLECVFKKQVHVCDPTKVASNKRAQYCWRCESEVYNILYCLRKYRSKKIELETYCYRCAIGHDATLANYTIMQQFDLKQLCALYEKFRFDYGGGKNSIASGVSQGIIEGNAAVDTTASSSSSMLTNSAAAKQLIDSALQYQQQQLAMSPVEHSTLLAARLTALAADAEKAGDSWSPPKKRRKPSTYDTNSGNPLQRSPVKMPCLPLFEASGSGEIRQHVNDTVGRNDDNNIVRADQQPAALLSSSPSKNRINTSSPIVRSSAGIMQKKRSYESINTSAARDDEAESESAITAEMDAWHAKKTAAAEKRAAKGVVVKQSRKKLVPKSQRSSPVLASDGGRTSADCLNKCSSSSMLNDDGHAAEHANTTVDAQVNKNRSRRIVLNRFPPRYFCSQKRQPPTNWFRYADSDEDDEEADDEKTTTADSSEGTPIKPAQKLKRQYKRYKRPNDGADTNTTVDADNDHAVGNASDNAGPTFS